MTDHRQGKSGLMRTGFLVTGSGLAVLTWAVASLIAGMSGWWSTAVIIGAIAGLAATMAGFAVMVVAANPFEDDELDDPTRSRPTA